MGSLSSSFIPAGRLGTDPLSPRASSCRIGPRRQGFASPLRALDGSGPIRKTRCLRGERGGAGRGAGGVARIVGESSGPLVHDKGYYHSYLGRSRKLAFGPTRRLSRSRGALSPTGPQSSLRSACGPGPAWADQRACRSNVTTSYRERRAGSIRRQTAERSVEFVTMGCTGARKPQERRTASRVYLKKHGGSLNYPWSHSLILSSLFSMSSTIRTISLSDGPLLR